VGIVLGLSYVPQVFRFLVRSFFLQCGVDFHMSVPSLPLVSMQYNNATSLLTMIYVPFLCLWRLIVV